MKYLLINRKNILIDILSELRYIKLHPSGYVVACSKKEGIGVIGSDCDTFYPLIYTDTANSENAVRIIEREEIAENVVPNFYKFDFETNDFVYRYTLEEAQILKQEQNKKMFAAYLAENPLTWTDGKVYGITLEDQTEINLKLNQYEIAVQNSTETPVLEWHAKQEVDVPWTLENLSALSLAINAAVYPHYHKCQDYKKTIFETNSIEELNNIVLDYDS